MVLNLLYLILVLLLLPWVAWRRVVGRRPVAAVWTRLTGLIEPLPAPTAPRLWLHGVSVGEIQLLAGLAREIEQRAAAAGRPIECVASSSTTTGLALAAARFSPDRSFPCPLDFTWAVRRVLDRVRPAMLILGELELWPNLLAAADARGIPIVVVNARMSQSSFQGYRRIDLLARRMIGRLDLVLARSAEDADRFVRLGGRDVRSVGSLKFDGVAGNRDDSNVLRLRRLAKLPDDAIVFLAGSTQAPEEELSLATFLALSPHHPRLRLILVPRHVERTAEIASLLDASGLPWQLRSRLESDGPLPGARILLVDTTGELGWWWGTADIAFVGGSLDGRRGGQNMLEPAAYGAALCFGPHTRNFRDEVLMLLEAGAAEVVHSGDELTDFVNHCLADPTVAADRGRRAQALVAAHRGGRSKTAELILARLGTA